MNTLGIIGSGSIGGAIARLAVGAGIPIVIANSRGPESLADLVRELGDLATAGTVAEAAAAGDVVVLSIPLTAVSDLPASLFNGKVVLDTSNYYPYRDGRIVELDSHAVTTSERVQQHFDDAHVVKAFNNILAHHIPQLARPAGARDRSALPIAGDDVEAKKTAAELIHRLGFDTVDAGGHRDSWRFEPEALAYTRLYLADPTVPAESMLSAPAAPVGADRVAQALRDAQRVNVADRTF